MFNGFWGVLIRGSEAKRLRRLSALLSYDVGVDRVRIASSFRKVARSVLYRTGSVAGEYVLLIKVNCSHSR